MKCRGATYVREDNVKRFQVTDDQVKWSVTVPTYKPNNHTSDSVLKQPIWADFPEDIIRFVKEFDNALITHLMF